MKQFDAKTFSEDDEIAAIISFVESRWDTKNVKNSKGNYAFADFVKLVFGIGLDATAEWVDSYSSNVHEYIEQRQMFLKKYHPTESYLTDVIHKYLYSVFLNKSDFANKVTKTWNYEACVNAAISVCKRKFDGIMTLKPIDYATFKKDYEDYDGQEEYCQHQQKIDEDDFRGTNNDTSRSSPFPSRIALPYVVYDDVCQGRSPINILVGAIIAQGMMVSQQFNDSEVEEAISLLDITQPYSQAESEFTFVYSEMIEKICMSDSNSSISRYPATAKFISVDDAITEKGKQDTTIISEICEKIETEKKLEKLQHDMQILADQTLNKYKEMGSIIHNSWMEDCSRNGYKIKCAVIETKSGTLKKLKFDPSLSILVDYYKDIN